MEAPKAAPRFDKSRIPPVEYDDSLSSLSIESEDDGNLLNLVSQLKLIHIVILLKFL